MLVFENTNSIKHAMLQMVKEHGEDILDDTNKFISLMNDYLPEFEKERRLLKHVLNNGVLATMRREDNQKIAIMKVREYMTNELFLADGAVEFVLVCLTYMMEWNYTEPSPAQQAAAQASTTAPAPAAPASRGGLTSPTRQGNAPSVPGVAAKAATAQPAVTERKFTSEEAKRATSLFSNTVKVPEGYTTIAEFCFDSSRVKAIDLPSSLYVIGEYAFSDCKKLKSIEIPANVKRIGKGAFSSCGKLTMLKIPTGVTEIEDSTFELCSGLEVIELPNTISSIGEDAFMGCMSLKKIFLTDSVKYIDDSAFSKCPSLTIRCYENSYVHKFCQNAGLRFETVRKGFNG